MKGGKMLNNKRGMSEAIMTVIMIVLILVAVGVIWLVVQRVLNNQSTTIDYSQKCFGVDFKPTNVTGCSVTIDRTASSLGEAISGVGITHGDGSKGEYEPPAANIGSTVTITVPEENCVSGQNSASVRWYFLDDKNEKHYCSAINKYP